MFLATIEQLNAAAESLFLDFFTFRDVKLPKLEFCARKWVVHMYEIGN